MEDYMEYGQGLISLPNGWALEKETGNRIDPDGRVFNVMGEMLWAPDIVDPEEEDSQ